VTYKSFTIFTLSYALILVFACGGTARPLWRPDFFTESAQTCYLGRSVFSEAVCAQRRPELACLKGPLMEAYVTLLAFLKYLCLLLFVDFGTLAAILYFIWYPGGPGGI